MKEKIIDIQVVVNVGKIECNGVENILEVIQSHIKKAILNLESKNRKADKCHQFIEKEPAKSIIKSPKIING